MQYQIVPVGKMWQSGSFCIPSSIVTDYIKLASEYQLKALMLVLASNGTSDSKSIAKSLGCTESDADDFLDFWVEEGVLSKDGAVVEKAEPIKQDEPATQSAPAEPEPQKKIEALPVPTLTSKDIIDLCRDNESLEGLLRTAEEVLGRILSHVERQLIVNMNTYYGLPADVVLVILQYYKTEKDNGRAIGNAYISAMAKDWAEQGITTLEAADEKLHDLEQSDRLWNEIVALSGIRHKSPTKKQREMVKAWYTDFGIEMISLACDAMKENAQSPSLKYVEGILKNWKKKGIATPDQVVQDNAEHSQKKASGEKIDATYDISSIEQKAMFNDDFDI